MVTANKLTRDEIQEYKIAARDRHAKEMQALAQREKRAWEIARRVSTLLRQQFGATRVKVFGSLIHEGCFTPWSDVDIAAWGIQAQDTFQAMTAFTAIEPEIKVNLIDVNVCTDQLLHRIEREGVDL